MITKYSKHMPLILILILIILAFLGVLSIYNIREEIAISSQLLTQVEQAESKDAIVQSINGVGNSNGIDIQAFEGLALNDTSLVDMIETIEKAARSLNVEARTQSVDKIKPATEAEPQKLRVTIEGTGSWSNNLAFLKALESLPYRVMFDNVSLTKEGSTWKSTITFSLYSFK